MGVPFPSQTRRRSLNNLQRQLLASTLSWIPVDLALAAAVEPR